MQLMQLVYSVLNCPTFKERLSLLNMVWGDIDWSSSNWLELLTERKEHLNADNVETLNLLLFYHHGESIQDKVKVLVSSCFHRYVDDNEHVSTAAWVLKAMRWQHLYYNQCLQALQEIATKKICDICDDSDSFDETLLDKLKEWEDDTFNPFIHQLFGDVGDGLTGILNNIHYKLVEQYIHIRIEKIFEMIMDFPDSLASLKELRDSIAICGNIGMVGRSVRSTLVRRLLHLGASTSQILDFYVSMIKALRVIDPSDALLNYVAVPVRKYLKERKDAIRCIISSLTDSKDSDLHSELKHGGSLAYGVDEDDEDLGPGENWQPNKRNKELADASISSSRGLDILATLVSIYGSTELFIVEYKSLLANRLINNTKYSTDQEVANLELLKIRFGEESLHSCEVMIKDIEDSKRFNTAVHNESKDGKCKTVDYVVVSDHYWPSFNTTDMKYHESISNMTSSYCDSFAVLKKPRKLNPLNNVGTVELDLTFDNGKVRTFSVTPLQANIILFVADENENCKSLQDIWIRMEADEEDCAAALRFWTSKKVLKEIEDPMTGDMMYEIIENQQNEWDNDDTVMDQDDVNDAADNAKQKAAKDMVESYAKGLLNSHGAMSIDKLFSLLQLVLQAASQQGSAGISMTSREMAFMTSISGLRQFLQQLHDQGDIDIIDGMYSVAKK